MSRTETVSPKSRLRHLPGAASPDPSSRDGVDWARLHALETLWNPVSRDILAGLGIRPGWRCLELGAGSGSLARWLAHRCQRGGVVATEVDLRFLRADRVPKLEVVVHDVVDGDDFPAESFDLVHIRAVLAYLPDRERAIERAVSWLAPGGWLVVEEPALYPVDSSQHAFFRRCLYAYARVMADTQGADLRWSRHLPSVLARAGLVDPGLRASTMVVGGGGPADAFWRITLAQAESAMLREGLLGPGDLRRALSLLDEPSFLDFSFALVSSWARKPWPGDVLLGQP